jgi:hypothetical protein
MSNDARQPTDPRSTDARQPTAAIARRLYDGNAAAPAVPTNPQNFYGYGHVAQAVDTRGAELWKVGSGARTQAEIRDWFVDVARTGIPDGIVEKLTSGYIDGELAVMRSEDPAAAAEALQTRMRADNEQTREALRTTYGAKEGEALLERMQRFVRAHPKLQSVLAAHGLGSRPDIVEGIAAHVFSQGLGR